MKLTEDDPELSLRGWLSAKTNIPPTDPRMIHASIPVLEFWAHWIKKSENEWWERLGSMLGTNWDRSDVLRLAQNKDKDGEPPTSAFIPLAMLINPGILDGLIKIFRVGKQLIADGEYIPERGEEIVSLGDLPKEAFLKAITQTTAAIHQQVGPSMAAPEDPQVLDKMRQQMEMARRAKP